MPFSIRTLSNTFEVVLFEGTNDIQVNYLDVTSRGAGRTSAGIENYDGTIGIGYPLMDTAGQYKNIYVRYTTNNTSSFINHSPVADAGNDQWASVGDTVILDGSGSYDSDQNDVLTYQWVLKNGLESGDNVTDPIYGFVISDSASIILSNPTSAQASFIVPDISINGAVLEFELTVKDRAGLESTDKVQVNVGNEANSSPIAYAGVDLWVKEGDRVTLDGTKSYDPEGSLLTYSWSLVSMSGQEETGLEEYEDIFGFFDDVGIAPDTSLTIENAASPHPSFVVPHFDGGEGLIIFELTVKDQSGLSSKSDQVSVYVGQGKSNGTSLYFPRTLNRDGWDAEICIINTSSHRTLEGFLIAYTNKGEEVSEPKSLILPPYGRREFKVSQFFENPASIDYIIFDTSLKGGVGYCKYLIEGKYRAAVEVVPGSNSGDIYVPHIASDEKWTTEITLVNTTGLQKQIDILFDNGENVQIGLDAFEQKIFTIKELRRGYLAGGVYSAAIKNASGIIGIGIYESGYWLSGFPLLDKLASKLYYPHIASDKIWVTGVLAFNPDESDCLVSVNPYDIEGELLDSNSFTLGQNGKYLDLFRNMNLPQNTAWFEVEASRGIQGAEFWATLDGRQYGAISNVAIQGKEGVLAKVDKDGPTGIVIVNPNNGQAEITLGAYDDVGNVITTETLNLNAHQKIVGQVRNIFLGPIDGASYIRYSANFEVVTMQMNGSFNGMMLDALPGIVIKNYAPEVTILSPLNGAEYTEGNLVSFNGTAIDPEDGTITDGGSVALGPNYVWTSNIDGQIAAGTSFVKSDLSPGSHKITLSVRDSNGLTGSASVALTILNSVNHAPVAEIILPYAGSSFVEKTSISFQGRSNDYEDGTLSGNRLVWVSDRDGQIGTGSSFSYSGLSVGSHKIALTATDSKGLEDKAEITITITKAVTNTPPEVPEILSPGNGSSFAIGAAITFSGTANDPEDGIINNGGSVAWGPNYVWTSNIDGQIAAGTLFVKSDLSAGKHIITLTARDSGGLANSTSITITILEAE